MSSSCKFKNGYHKTHAFLSPIVCDYLLSHFKEVFFFCFFFEANSTSNMLLAGQFGLQSTKPDGMKRFFCRIYAGEPGAVKQNQYIWITSKMHTLSSMISRYNSTFVWKPFKTVLVYHCTLPHAQLCANSCLWTTQICVLYPCILTLQEVSITKRSLHSYDFTPFYLGRRI